MRMSQTTYDTLLSEFRATVAKMEETGCTNIWGRAIDLDALTMRDMWDFVLVSNIDRGNADHPRYRTEGLLPRVHDFTDRNVHWLYQEEDLDDSHIETALRKIAEVLQADRLDRVQAAVPAL